MVKGLCLPYTNKLDSVPARDNTCIGIGNINDECTIDQSSDSESCEIIANRINTVMSRQLIALSS
jgi:hypothetical protein